MFEEMKKDPAVKLQLASDYASIANYWKFFDGETKQLIKYDVYNQKKKQEDAYAAWAKGKAEYESVFTDWPKAYEAWKPYSKHRVFINEGILGSRLLAFASSLMQVENALVKQGGSAAISNAVAAADRSRNAFIKSENIPSDRNILALALEMYYNEIDKSQHPIGFFESIKGSYGDLKDPNTFKKYVADVFTNTMILNNAKWQTFVSNPDATGLQADPAYAAASAFVKNWQSKYLQQFQIFTAKNNELSRLYLKGILQKDTVKAKLMYPDATFTMRVSYGQVKAYKPRDGVSYDYVTTMKGVLEKYKPGDYEFDLPQQVLDLARKRDFGQYIDKQRNDLVIGFITTNDITGGNSGSPVINGNGELTGLVFDGNYEALSHKIAFDKDLNRTMCVDVRYVLWCIDKVGNAQNIINELKLVK